MNISRFLLVVSILCTKIILGIFNSSVCAQDAFTVKLSGLVKTDIFYDSRQTVSAREGHFLLFPSPELRDNENKDLNAKSGFNILPIQSNLSAGITGPSALGASISGVIEGDFFGTTNNDINLFRLRHAYIKLKWKEIELLTGQYWHPVFPINCYPATISFNTGSPIQPFSRAPQVKFTYIPGILRLSVAVITQRDYASMGPDGATSRYLRDSGMPEFFASGELNLKKESELILGFGIGYKNLVPQTKTGKGYKTSEKVSGMSVNAYLKFSGKLLTFKLHGAYLENASDLLTLSGFAVKDSLDIDKGLVSYVTCKAASVWSEISTHGKLFQAGIFAGYSENLGTGTEVKGPFYLMSNVPVKSIYRISPRVLIKPGPVTFGLEIEYTSARYGTPEHSGEIINTSKTANMRVLLSTIYKF